MSTFNLGISGLSAAKKHLNTVGNNIANASTVGFKKSRAEFADVYAKSGLGSSSGQVGGGVSVTNIAQQFSQGGRTSTENSLDLRIDGNGFFVVEAGNGTTNYTRAGMFHVNNEGYIESSTGQKLQGYGANANGDGVAVGAIDDLFIPQDNIAPNATSELKASFNLDSRADAPTNYIFDSADSDTYTHIYPSVIYDTLGNSHTMTQYFIKQPPYLPEYGEPTRAIQSLLGAAKYGADGYLNSSNYPTLNDGENVFPGDIDEDANPATTELDSDIAEIFTGIGGGFNFNTSFLGAAPIDQAGVNANAALTSDQAAIEAAIDTAIAAAATGSGATGAGAFTDALAATPAGDADAAASAAEAYLAGLGEPQAVIDAARDAILAAGSPSSTTVKEVYSDRLSAIKTALQGMMDSSSGRTKEYYEDIYKAVDDYIPTVNGDISKDVFDGAIAEIEQAISGGSRAYAGVDTIAGELRMAVMDSAAVPAIDPLTAELNIGNLKGPLSAPVFDASDFEAAYENIVAKLEAGRDANTGTEEGGVYQLALNALQDVDKDWSTDDSAQESMLKVLDALESEAADNRWQVHVTIDGEKVTDDNENTPDYFSFNFTEFGILDEPMPTMKIKDWVPKDSLGNVNGSDEPQVFEINLDGTTQFAGSFGAKTLSQDGFATGELAGLEIDDAGTIVARYTNSETRLIGQVALANFRNEQGLTPVGGTMWVETSESGDPVVNSPGVGIAGSIESRTLEDANVDLSEELVDMIIAQRDYQANAKTLQTADTLTQTIINLR
ncbi:flagellar hook-basal body complex protein [Oceanospirillum maris]|uniref:flagellar hook-basal body complex protein n=1 Tax=Oceanospirillum maris TaxID=64977 RepID=UPI000408A564|nr:flagellar hook-basal body complex protein [Oceanospirillum maris]